MIILRSTISNTLKGVTLKRGAFFTLSGGFLFLIGAFIPFSLLTTCFFLISCLLIALGLVPYRRLLLEEIHPNEIHFDGEELFFLQKKNAIFKLKREHIENIHFLEKKGEYGISLQIKKPFQEQVIVLTSKGRFLRYLARCKRIDNIGDLYLPFFTRRSYKELIESLNLNLD